jgi:hypothetical protein
MAACRRAVALTAGQRGLYTPMNESAAPVRCAGAEALPQPAEFRPRELGIVPVETKLTADAEGSGEEDEIVGHRQRAQRRMVEGGLHPHPWIA